MAESNDLKISVIATLNTTASTSEINRKIKEIERHLDPIKLKVDVDQASINAFQQRINQLGQTQQNTSRNIQDTTRQISNQNNAISQATNNTMSFSQQLGVAFQRTAIWSVATTAIYGTLRALQSMTEEILLVDSAMTELKRVMDAAPQTYNELLHESIALSKELGNSIHDILKAVNGFARAGQYTKEQLMDLAKTATVASNVSDLTADEAMNNMIATMNVFKIEASETMEIIDKMNEVDNNFAISTKQISEAMSRSAGVAASFGVTIDELIGDITAIGSVTFESGTIIGRALKTIYSRITTMSEAEDILNSVGISIKNLAGDNREVSDILKDLRGKWDTLSNSQQQNIAVTLAGRDQLTRFIALMRSADVAMNATKTSINSHGSALKENEKYLQSMGAQLNKLKSSFTEMSVVVGENGLGQVFMALVKTLTFMANGFSAFTESTKGLNIILPIVGLSIFGVVKAFNALKVAATGAKLSLGWIGLGVIALEGLTTAAFGASKAYGDTIDTFIESSNNFSQSADRLEQLAQKYEELKPQAVDNSEAQKELTKVLDEINRIAPNVIENTDKYGNSLTVNKDKVDEFAESLRKMSDEQLKSATAQLNIDFSQAKTELDSLKIKQNEAKDEVSDFYNTMLDYQKKYKVNSLVEAAKEYRKRQSKLSGEALREAANEYGKYHQIMTIHSKKMKDYSSILDKVNDAQAEVDGLENRRKQIEFLTSGHQKLAKTIEEAFDNKLTTEIYGDFDENQLKSLIEFGNQIKNNKDNIQQYIPILEKSKLTKEQINEVLKALSINLQNNGEAWEENGEQADLLAKKYDNAISNIESLNGIINELNDSHSISSKTIGTIMEKYEHLLPYINDEVALRQKVQEEITKEEKVAKQAMLGKLQANEGFYKAALQTNDKQVQAFYDNYGIDLKAYKSLGKAKIAVEKEVLGKVTDAWDSHTQRIEAITKTGLMVGNPMGMSINMALIAMKDNATEVKSALDDIFLDQIDLISGTSIAQSGLSDSTKKTGKEYESSIYVSDRFKQSLESLNAELEKQRAIQAKFPDHSKQYQSALKNELSLLKQKKQLLEDQAKSLASQIKSGKIQQTGIITNKNPSSSPTSSSYASGGSNADTIWNFFKSKGFSDSIVAGIMGNLRLESNLNPNALNKSSGAFGIAQWLGGRKTGLQNYAKSIGSSVNDLTTQLNFLWKELNGSEKKTLNYLNSNQGQSAAVIARMFDQLFERSEGTHVPQRQQYANQFLSQYSGTGAIPVSANTSDASKAAAENLQSIDQAKSELLQLQSDITGMDEALERLELEIIKTPLTQAEHRFRQIDSNMKIIEARMSKQDPNSKAYRTELENQVILLKEKKKLTEQNMIFIENELKKNKNLTEMQRNELQQTYLDLRDSLVDLDNAIVDNRNDFLNSALDGLNDRLDKSNQKYIDQIQLLDHLIDLSGNDLEKRASLEGQKLSLLVNQKKEIENNIKLLESQNKNLTNNKQALEKNVEETKKWKDALMGVESSIQSIYNDLANKVIEAQKEYYREKMQAELDAIEQRDKALKESYEQEMKLIDEAYKKKIKALDDELKMYQKIIKAQMDAIDDQESERSYDKELDKLTEEKLKLEAEYEKYSLDNSLEGKAKKLELEEQLKEKIDQINELKHQREVELRKEGLQDALDKKQEEVDNAKEAIEDQYNSEKEAKEQAHKDLQDQLDKDKEAIQKHYENIINDERKWASIREEIMKGNLSSLTNELNGFSSDVSMNMSHMGDSIKNNLIDKIKEAIDLLQTVNSMGLGGFETGVNRPSPPSSGGNGGSSIGGSGNGSSSGGSKPPVIWDGMEMKEGQIGRITVTKPINLWKRNGGKLEMERVLQAGDRYRVYGYDDAFGGQFDVGSGMWVTNMPSHIKYETPSKDKLQGLQRFNTGGYTGNSEGLAYLDKKELILNQDQTKDIFKSIDALNRFKHLLPKFNMPNFIPNQALSIPQGETIIIQNVNIEKADNVDDLVNQVKKKMFGSMTNGFKGRGGIIR